MKKNYLASIIIISQILFLSSMILFHNAQLKDAVFIRLKTVPYDPVSIFRGHYATLRYEINSLPVGLLKDAHPKDLREGEELFVLLKEDKGSWQPQAIYKNKKLPQADGEVYLAGRLKHYYWVGRASGRDDLYLEYGIESFFLEESSAKDVERENLRGGSTWQERQQRRKELLTQLDEETRRISEARITKWWVDTLGNELKVWVKDGFITREAGDKIQDRYRRALEKISSVDQELNLRGTSSRNPIVTEVAVDRHGRGHPIRLFVGDKVYR